MPATAPRTAIIKPPMTADAMMALMSGAPSPPREAGWAEPPSGVTGDQAGEPTSCSTPSRPGASNIDDRGAMPVEVSGVRARVSASDATVALASQPRSATAMLTRAADDARMNATSADVATRTPGMSATAVANEEEEVVSGPLTRPGRLLLSGPGVSRCPLKRSRAGGGVGGAAPAPAPVGGRAGSADADADTSSTGTPRERAMASRSHAATGGLPASAPVTPATSSCARNTAMIGRRSALCSSHSAASEPTSEPLKQSAPSGASRSSPGLPPAHM